MKKEITLTDLTTTAAKLYAKVEDPLTITTAGYRESIRMLLVEGFARLRVTSLARQSMQRRRAADELREVFVQPYPELFRGREVLHVGVSARPQLSCRTPNGTAHLALAIINAQTAEQREAAQRAAEAALNHRMAV